MGNETTAAKGLGVYQAISGVQAALAKTGISKDKNNLGQQYKFRGIDDIYNAIAPLLCENGLVILPRVLSREVIERQTKSGGILFYVVVGVEFDFIGVDDGSTHTIKTYGEAMDSSDKATNKAMSAAYKYACLQAFCIPTEGDNDTENHDHHVIASPPKKVAVAPQRATAKPHPTNQNALLEKAIEDMRAAKDLLSLQGEYKIYYKRLEDNEAALDLLSLEKDLLKAKFEKAT